MKPPKNFYSNLDRRKQGLPEVPEASAADAGKIIKVGEDGAYELGADENTIIIANPEGVESSELLNVLQIGNQAYLVNDRDVYYVDATIDSISSPTKITLTGMTKTDFIHSAKYYKEHIIVAKTSDNKKSIFFHQYRDDNDPIQRSMNFYSFGYSFPSLNKIFSCIVIAGDTPDISVSTTTL